MKQILLFIACSLYLSFAGAQVVNKQSGILLPATQSFLEKLSQTSPQRISPHALVPFNTDKNGHRYSSSPLVLSQEEKQNLTAIGIYRKQQELSNFGSPVNQYSPIKMVPLETIILNAIFSNK